MSERERERERERESNKLLSFTLAKVSVLYFVLRPVGHMRTVLQVSIILLKYWKSMFPCFAPFIGQSHVVL